jgi:hypothetical protein
MRTTVTIDEDVARLLKDSMHRSRRSFKKTLNTALRVGLVGRPTGARRTRFIVRARPMGLRAGVDSAGLNKLADDLEVDAAIAKKGRRKPA